MNVIDLNIDNYSLDDIFNLFNIKQKILDQETMKKAKQILLRTHPDKSNLEPKFFIFYSSAYNKLNTIYEFQNKTIKNNNNINTEYKNDIFIDKTNNNILNNLFDNNKSLKKTDNFNNWFNEKFEKHKLNDDNLSNGYGDWLKTDEGISNISKNEFEQYKKKIQSISLYKGYDEHYIPNSLGGTSILSKNNNYTSGDLFSNSIGFTDLKQAYEESVIPITEDDFNNTVKYKNIDEYKRVRDSVNLTTLNEQASYKKLDEIQKQQENESITNAYELAKQLEITQKKTNNFWSELKQITGH
jgi:hypothetical protein